MEEIKFSKYSSFLWVVLGYLLLRDGVRSETYTVGDENGWSSGTGTNYVAWSQRYNFSVGDVLVFKYSKFQHNVKEVTETTYQSCNASSGVLAIYETGNDEIKLTESRKYNFICDKDSHCLGGMRFWISVIEGSGFGHNTTTTGGAPPPLPPPSPEKSSALKRGDDHIYFIFGIGVLHTILL